MPSGYDPYHFKEPNLARTSVKRQHYVPQRYLDSFTHDGLIDVYEPMTAKSFSASVGNVAVESYFYDLRHEQEKVSTEDWFAHEVEGPFWPLLDRLIGDPTIIDAFTEQEETIIARYVAAQRLRVPRHREYIERTRVKARDWAADLLSNALKKKLTADEIDQHLSDDGTMPWLRSARTYQVGEAMSADLGEITGDARMLMAKPWRIGRSDASLPFHTSDNPVASHVPPVLPDWWDDFHDTEQFFALDPQTLLHFAPLPRIAGKIAYRGIRRCRDFTKWETSRARAIITYEATTYVYGVGGTAISRALASGNVFAFDDASRNFAIEFSGYDPTKPQAMPKHVIKLVDPRVPDVSSLTPNRAHAE